jgi:hypothetical protein
MFAVTKERTNIYVAGKKELTAIAAMKKFFFSSLMHWIFLLKGQLNFL